MAQTTASTERNASPQRLDPTFKNEVLKEHGGENTENMFPMRNLHIKLPNRPLQQLLSTTKNLADGTARAKTKSVVKPNTLALHRMFHVH